MKSDNYYDIGGIATIDYIKAKLTKEEYIGFLKGNILKYISRAGHKLDPGVSAEDMIKKDASKADMYLTWLIDAIDNA